MRSKFIALFLLVTTCLAASEELAMLPPKDISPSLPKDQPFSPPENSKDSNSYYITTNVGAAYQFYLTSPTKGIWSPTPVYELCSGKSLNSSVKLGLSYQFESYKFEFPSYSFLLSDRYNRIYYENVGRYFTNQLALQSRFSLKTIFIGKSINLKPHVATGIGLRVEHYKPLKYRQVINGNKQPWESTKNVPRFLRDYFFEPALFTDLGYSIGSKRFSATLGFRLNSYFRFYTSRLYHSIAPYAGFNISF